MIKTMPVLLIAWVIHAVVAAVVASPVVCFGRKRVHWRPWELLSLVIPFCVWMALMSSDMSTGSKTLSNLVVEPGILAVALALGALARVAMSTSMSEERPSAVTLAGLCIVAAGIFGFVPALQE